MEPITDPGQLFGWIQSIFVAMGVWDTFLTVIQLGFIGMAVKLIVSIWSR